MIKSTCQNCQKTFMVWPSWVRTGAGKNCSRKCAYQSRTGRVSYIRTTEHKAKMSAIVLSRDLTFQKDRMAQLGHAKKGKTYREIYGEARAKEILLKFGKRGPENPNWKGGKTRNRYPYIFYQLRGIILERDNYICMNCDMTDQVARAKDRLGRGLTVHHIDYDKTNNNLLNLITLCKWCNSSANSRREEWQIHYAQLLLGA